MSQGHYLEGESVRTLGFSRAHSFLIYYTVNIFGENNMTE